MKGLMKEEINLNCLRLSSQRWLRCLFSSWFIHLDHSLWYRIFFYKANWEWGGLTRLREGLCNRLGQSLSDCWIPEHHYSLCWVVRVGRITSLPGDFQQPSNETAPTETRIYSVITFEGITTQTWQSQLWERENGSSLSCASPRSSRRTLWKVKDNL